MSWISLENKRAFGRRAHPSSQNELPALPSQICEHENCSHEHRPAVESLSSTEKEINSVVQEVQQDMVSCPANTERAGREDMCKGCPGKALCQSLQGGVDPDIATIKVRMNAIKHKILVLSGKGGMSCNDEYNTPYPHEWRNRRWEIDCCRQSLSRIGPPSKQQGSLILRNM